MTRAAIYARISRDSERDGAGVARQEEDCRALIEARRWEYVRTFTDNDISATRKKGRVKDRPEYQEMCREIEAGTIDAVVAWELDRLGRDPAELEAFFIVCEKAGLYRIATAGADSPINIDTGEGLLMARIKAAVAAEETRKMGQRIRAKRKEEALAGKPHRGGKRGFGYENDRMTIVAEEADAIRWAADHLLTGGKLTGVVKRWNEDGITTAGGKPWQIKTVKDLMLDSRIYGLREHKGVVVAVGKWPAILPEETGRRIRSLLVDPSRARGAIPRSYLLAGFLKCARCGFNMLSNQSTPRPGYKYRSYRCNKDRGGCGSVSIAAERVEEAVVVMVLAAYGENRFGAKRQHDKAEYDEVVEAINRDEAALEELMSDYYASGSMSRGAFMKTKATVEQRLAGSRRRLDKLRGDDTATAMAKGGVSLADQWDSLGFDQRRLLIGRVLSHVEVKKAPPRSVTLRLVPHWVGEN